MISLPACSYGAERGRGSSLLGSRGALRGQFPAAWHCHSPDTPATAATPDAPTCPEEERRGQLAPGSWHQEPRSKAVRNDGKKGASTEAGQGEVQVPCLPRPGVPSPAGTSLLSPLLLLLLLSCLPPARPLAQPSQPPPPPQALKDTAARWPATPGRPRVEGSRRAPRPARGSPRRPALPGAALAHRPVLLVRPVAADAQPWKAAGSQRSAAAGAPAAAPGAEQQQERSTCGGRHLSTGNGAGPGSAADGRGVARTRHSAAPGQLRP